MTYGYAFSYFLIKNKSFTVVYFQVWNCSLMMADEFIGEGGFSLFRVRNNFGTKEEFECKLI